MSRKHTKQMTPREREALREAIDSIHTLGKDSISEYSDHSFDRLVEKGLSAVDMLNCVRFGIIVEAHCKHKGDIRVLLRLATKKGNSICTVVSLRDENIVTAYYNDNKDKHFTIDWSEYNWKVELVEAVKRFMQKKAIRGAKQLLV